MLHNNTYTDTRVHISANRSNEQSHFHSLWTNTKQAARHQTMHPNVNTDASKKNKQTM